MQHGRPTATPSRRQLSTRRTWHLSISAGKSCETGFDPYFAASRFSGEWLKGGSGIVTTATNLSAGSRFDIAFPGQRRSRPCPANSCRPRGHAFPVVAANGRWLAYTSNRSGHDDVYVRAWNRPGNAMRLTAVGSTEPVWSPNGAELYFRSSDTQDLIDVSFAETADRIVVLQRRALFPIGDMLPGFTHANFDVSPDGNAFVMVRQSPADAIHVIKNLPEICGPCEAAPGNRKRPSQEMTAVLWNRLLLVPRCRDKSLEFLEATAQVSVLLLEIPDALFLRSRASIDSLYASKRNSDFINSSDRPLVVAELECRHEILGGRTKVAHRIVLCLVTPLGDRKVTSFARITSSDMAEKRCFRLTSEALSTPRPWSAKRRCSC